MAQADDLVSIEYVSIFQRNCFLTSLKRKQLFHLWTFEVQKYSVESECITDYINLFIMSMNGESLEALWESVSCWRT